MKANAAASLAVKALTKWLAKGRVAILTYHQVLERADPLRPSDPTRDDFDVQIATIARSFRCVTLHEATRSLFSGRPLASAAVVTFDDGYRDNFDIALPILKKHGVPATFFVSTGFLRGDMMWNDRVIETIRTKIGGSIDLTALGREGRELPDESAAYDVVRQAIGQIKHMPPMERSTCVADFVERNEYRPQTRLMMNDDEVCGLHRAGMEIGAHTISHPILSNLDREDAYREIAGSKEQLETLLDAEVKSFAYPNGRRGGDFDDREIACVREAGFDAAVSTEWACASRSSDRFALPRTGIWGRSGSRILAQMLRNFAVMESRRGGASSDPSPIRG